MYILKLKLIPVDISNAFLQIYSTTVSGIITLCLILDPKVHTFSMRLTIVRSRSLTEGGMVVCSVYLSENGKIERVSPSHFFLLGTSRFWKNQSNSILVFRNDAIFGDMVDRTYVHM